MIKTLKKITLSLCSIFGLSIVFWIVFLMNPSLSYAHQTSFERINVYHNLDLAPEMAVILAKAYEKIKPSELFDPTMKIELAMNDGSKYPKFHPLAGGLAYSFLNKTVLYRCTGDFAHNRATFSWEENKGELRHYDLVELLAHEFTHNLQYQKDWLHPLKYETWKIEGYADYVSRQTRLKEKSLKEHIQHLIHEESKPHLGIPRFMLEDGTGWLLSYYGYCLMVQYLIEEKGMSYQEVLESKLSMEEVREEMQLFARQ